MFKFAKIKNHHVPSFKPYWMLCLDNPKNFMDYMEIRMVKLNEDYMGLKQRLANREQKSKDKENFNIYFEETGENEVQTNLHFISMEEKIINTTLANTPNRKSVVDDIFALSDRLLKPLQDAFLFKGETIFINQVGGWFTKSKSIEVLETIERDTFEFPKDGKSKEEYIKMIKITKWEGGNHYYAKIGHEDVVDKDGNVKWNSHDTAHTKAVEYIEKELDI